MSTTFSLPTTTADLYSVIAKALDLPPTVKRLSLTFESKNVVDIDVCFIEIGPLKQFYRKTLKAPETEEG